jgi:CO/xanthine dehydrogenase FAD-binding subunit
MTLATEVLIPSTPDEAVRLFGDGTGVTVIAGGTIVLPDITYGTLQPAKALLLARAGLAGVTRDGGRVTIGAGTPISDLVDLPAPLGPCAANVADGEIRSQATLGGNLRRRRRRRHAATCRSTARARRGRRSVGSGGETPEPLEEFLARRDSRLLLDVSFAEPAAGAFAALDYPHTHEYTVLAVSGARGADGTVRLAATGLAGHGWRLRSAEAAAGDPEAAGAAAVADVRLGDDALASAWYREKTLPVLVRRVLSQLEEAA